MVTEKQVNQVGKRVCGKRFKVMATKVAADKDPDTPGCKFLPQSGALLIETES